MVAIRSRTGGRRYPQCSAAAGIVCVIAATSLGSPSAPAATLGSRRYPQRSQAQGWQRPLVATSVGSPAGGGGGGGSTAGFSRAQAVNNVMLPLKQNTARNEMVFLVDSADHVTGKTGLTLTITASKDGAAFASISPSVTERGTGWYNIALTSSHTDTLGDLAFHVTGTGADPCDFKLPVEVERTGLLGATGIQAIWDALTSALTTVGSIGKTLVTNLDAAVSTRAPESAGNVAAIKTVTDQLTAAQAEPTSVPASTASPLSKLAWIFMLSRNKMTETSAQMKVRNNADNADIGTANTFDDGTTFTRGGWS